MVLPFSFIKSKLTNKRRSWVIGEAFYAHGHSVSDTPLCLPGQREFYGGLNDKAIRVSCDLESMPRAYAMHWAFNTTSELMHFHPMPVDSEGRQRTVLSYVPKSHLDYGSLLCWGENSIGRQKIPCVFQVCQSLFLFKMFFCSKFASFQCDFYLY